MTVELPLQVLNDLMFGYQEFFGERPLSVTQREPEAHTPKMVPVALAQIIAERDKLNPQPIFHIEIYPTHGEIWNAYEWQISVSRKYKIVEESSIRSEKYLAINESIAAKQLLFAKVKKHLIDINVIPEPVKANAAMCDQLVRVLMLSSKDVTDKIEGLTELVYGNLPEGSEERQ